MNPSEIALAPMWYVVFLLSLTCHEASHALAAKLGGDLTAFEGGQVTLNPIPHMKREPFGTILFPLITYFMSGWMMGWASAPFDPQWAHRHPRRAAWMALAGPAANLTLVLLAAVIIHAGMLAGVFSLPGRAGFTHIVDAAPGSLAQGGATLLSILFSLNLLLFVFNLLPMPPLDGITALGVLLPEKAAHRVAQWGHNPAFMLLGMVVAWKFFGYLFDPLFTLGLNLLYPGHSFH
ncbi:MAG TPA: site-2 protease family protein [Terriglobia bacterium]|nr:site-2 protease family protein [Terriglobia bacterium]